MEDKNFVGKYGLFATIVVAISGVSIFSYPKELTIAVGTDGWIVTIFAGLIAFMLLYLIYKVLKVNKFETFNNILEYNLGKGLGKITALIFVIYNILFVSMGLRVFAEVVKMYLLEKTPTEFILLLMILTGTYLVRGDIKSLIKFNEVAFGIMFVPIFLVMIFALEQSDFTNLLPILHNKPTSYLEGTLKALFAFGGFQVAYLVLPFMRNRDGIPKILRKSIIFITAFYVLIVIFSLAVFSREQTKILLWPTLTMIKSIDIPGSFVERWEGLVMAFWTIFYFTTFVNVYYFSADIVKNTFTLEDVKLSSLILAPFIYVTALYSENIAEVYNVESKILPIFSVVTMVIIPLILLMISSIRYKGERK